MVSKYIYNLSPPLHQYDAATKGYVDGVAKKCHVWLIPTISRNVDKTGYNVTSSSQQRLSYAAFEAFRFGNAEWAMAVELSNFCFKDSSPRVG